ncbi:MAG: amidohydrolase family protein [Gammaproteobacteria bacterium]|nr:amidohydrolase family protein [Gammaproteobacteria bacterium]
MKTVYSRLYATIVVAAGVLAIGSTAMASHRVMLFNEKAMEKILDVWPDFVVSVNNQARGVDDPGGRGIILQSPLRAHLNQLLREQPTPEQYGFGFTQLVQDYYHRAGMTTFGSRLNTNEQVTAYNYMLRRDGRLPIRFAYSFDLARQPMATVSAAALYESIGSLWQTIDSNPWLWMHGMSSEGDWDAPNRGCQGEDLPVKPGVNEREVKEILEICPDFNSATVQALMRGLRSGWRFAGVHGVGSKALRIFVDKLEEQMSRNPGLLTMDYVLGMRNGFAHGTLTGALPDVVADLVKYNLYLPINLRRALAIEPTNIEQHYGEPGYAFLGPVRTLIDQGVNVVGEAEIVLPNPRTYIGLLDIYVNREIGDDGQVPAAAGEGTVYGPDEAVDRVVALKLFTRKSAEFLYAESKVGSLEPGKFADFIVVENDYLSGPDSEIKNNKVIMTVLAGETVYQDDDYAPEVRQTRLSADSR